MSSIRTSQTLPVLFPPLRIVIGGLTFSQLVGVLNSLTTSETNPLSTNECLTLACQNKVCSAAALLSFTFFVGHFPQQLQTQVFLY